jgi:cbb3-type cytochrome oxidase cytochrome c subunit
MKRWLARAVVILVVLLGAVAQEAPTLVAQRALASAQKQDPQTITVYVTRTGAKYHRDGCRYLSRSKIPMPLAEAVKRYGPCSVCKPPVLP